MVTEAAIKSLFVLGLVIGAFAPLVPWFERRATARSEERSAADRDDSEAEGSRAFRPLAQWRQWLAQEDVVPAGANRFVHLVAPLIALVPALAVFGVLPFGGVYRVGEGDAARRISLVVSEADWGLLFVFALASLAPYGVWMIGRSSDQDSLRGALRTAARMISYQVVLGSSLVGAFMVFGTLKPVEMGAAQDRFFWLADALPLPSWGIVLQPVAFGLAVTSLLVGLLPRVERPAIAAGGGALPPEGEAPRVVAEPSAANSEMQLALFAVAEFIGVVMSAGLLTTVFFGAWAIPYFRTGVILETFEPLTGSAVATALCILLHVATFFGKVAALIWLQVRIRASLPRLEYGPSMDLCWKILLPLALLNVFATAASMILLGETGSITSGFSEGAS